jgi:hypothetical protein
LSLSQNFYRPPQNLISSPFVSPSSLCLSLKFYPSPLFLVLPLYL